MQLKPNAIKELKQIIQQEYSVTVSEEEANNLGVSLLRLCRLAAAALARADESTSSVQSRDKIPSLKRAKTSVLKHTPLQALGESMRGL